MTLREELAQRMAEIEHQIRKDREPEFLGPGVPGRAFLILNQDIRQALADECIRQMEWARRECDRVAACHWGGPEHPECGDPNACCGEAIRENMAKDPLTLAPDGWKP